MADDPIEIRKIALDSRRLDFEIESHRVELEERRVQRDADSRRAELEHEVKLKELGASSGQGFRFSTGQATVAAAVLALLSGVAGGFIQAAATRDVATTNSVSQIEVEKLKANGTLAQEKQKQDAADKLERQKFETTLILKAIDTPDRVTQIRNLQFFVNAGFISDPDKKIINTKPDDLPSPVSNPVNLSPALSPNTDYTGLSPALVKLILSFEATAPDADQLRTLQESILKNVTVQINDNQLAALTSFTYNVGLNTLMRSNLLKAVNRSDFDSAAAEFLKWNKAGDRVLVGLTERRTKEVALFKTPVTAQDQAPAQQ